MNESTPLVVKQTGPIRTLTLNRPRRRNALNAALVDALDSALTDAEQHRPTRCVVLTGAGPSFCAGADLQHFLRQHAEVGSPIAFLRQVSALITRFEASPLPIVAALHGHAVAGGLELALACDVAVAAESTLIGDGHIRNNLLPAGGSSVRLPRKVGDAMARWLALTGQLVPARRLADAGWLHAVVPDDQLSSTVATVAMSLVESSGPAQSAFKSLLFDLTTMDAEHGLARELDIFDAHWNTNDVPAALTAFLQHQSTPTIATTRPSTTAP